MGVSAISQNNFQQEVLEQKGVVFVDFHASWCAPCRVTEPIVDELSEEFKDVKFVKVDVDQNPQLAQQYQVFSIPTFLIFKDGKVANQLIGAMGKENFVAEIKKVVS
ncbi:thioredoxin [Candidatus Roizmanbacteria bacterium]|nr:thioredoxin [Candidatus Roizmanbacteria bacterium]